MISYPPDSSSLFECYLMTNFKTPKDDITLEFTPSATPLSSDMTFIENFKSQCIILTQSDISDIEQETYIVAVKDINEQRYYCYIFCKNNLKDDGKSIFLLSIISKYLQPHLLNWAVEVVGKTGCFELFEELKNSKFENNGYDVYLNIKSEYNCPYYANHDLTTQGEYGKLLEKFIRNFSPVYIPIILNYLMHDSKIIVLSSSCSRISEVVLSILSFLYPFGNNEIAINFFPLRRNSFLEFQSMKGPCIFGVHSTMVNQLTKLIECIKDSFIIFNIDNVYIHEVNSARQETSPKLSEIILKYQSDLTNIIYSSVPAFPVYRIQVLTSNLITSIIGVLIEAENLEFQTILDKFESIQNSSNVQYKILSVFYDNMKKSDNELFKSMYFSSEFQNDIFSIPIVPYNIPSGRHSVKKSKIQAI